MAPPLHLSSPASATTSYAATYIQRYVHTLLAATGFSRSSKQATHLLVEMMERYLLLVGSTAQRHGAHAGRNVAVPADVLRALADVGTSTNDVQAWLLEDAGEVAGQWLSRNSVAEDDAVLAGNAVAGPSSLQRAGFASLSGIRALEERNRYAKTRYDEAERQEMYYEQVGSPRLRLLEDLLNQDDDAQTPALSDGSTEESVQSPHSSGRMEAGKEDEDESVATAREKRSDHDEGAIPSFLPPLPGESSDPSAINGELQIREDKEFAAQVEDRLQQGHDKSHAAENGVAQAGNVEPQVLKAEDLEQQPKRSVQDLWHRSVPFTVSALAASQSSDDIPSLHAEEGLRVIAPLPIEARTRSSVRAFANDYPELVNEQRSGEMKLLTPLSSAYSRIQERRRDLALFLADPSKYAPADTLFGSIGVRPSALPFAPTSSLLVTPPASTESAPRFTPIEPHGRAPPSSTTQSSALHPACRHRNASVILNAARRVTGGPYSVALRRTTRIRDPDAIPDEQHAERVFHGQPASRELLSEGHSFLKGAIDMLNAEHHQGSQALEMDNGMDVQPSNDALSNRVASDDEYDDDDFFDEDDEDEDDEYMGGSRKARNKRNRQKRATNPAPVGAGTTAAARQRTLSAAQERLKIKQGTIVATWDWMTRDYTDPQLPAKKFRKGTAGVALGGPNSNVAGQDDDN